jgi:hypothetical protein
LESASSLKKDFEAEDKQIADASYTKSLEQLNSQV